jgi:polysaccharide biosynthesis/export protein
LKFGILIFALAVTSLAAACGSSAPYVWVDELPAAAREAPAYKIHPGDRLLVNVWNQPALSGEVLVRSDGHITMPLVGDVDVTDLSPPDASIAIAKKLTGMVVDPNVAVSLAGGREPTVNVLGEVRTGGSFPLRVGEGVLELIARAGGLSEFAAKDRIFVVRKADGVRVRFSYDRIERPDSPGSAFELQDGDTIVVE